METNKETIKSVTYCPTCGVECKIGVGDSNSHYYIPIVNKEDFYKCAESLGIKINDAQRLMMLANKVETTIHKETPTAEKFLDDFKDFPMYLDESSSSDIEKVMIEFAKLHLTKQAEVIAEKALVFLPSHPHLHRTGNIDKQSILQASEEYINNLK